MDLVKLGTIVKAQGIKGEIKAYLDENVLENVKSLDTLFLSIKGANLPYFVSGMRKANDKSYFLLFEDVEDRNKAETLVGKEIFIEKKNLKKKVAQRGYTYAVGYKMIDENSGDVGIIDDVYEFPANDVAQVKINNVEVLFPLFEETVLKADKRKKILYVKLPDGLIDVYQHNKKQ
jgi:16S rRNA processing protein RimM